MINYSIVSDCIVLEGRYLPSQLDVLQNELFDVFLKSSGVLEVNLTNVVGSGSGLVALLLSFMRFANDHDRKIVFTGLSAQLVGLIQLSNLESIVLSA
ncbi:lipid asymmetry maintenance protein MlaB [Marinomonas sp. 2405UD68-3]|uniref:STAS domain-containing protein n=1 Tax=Marinomonas sp. 2405UD68-3 TaxID=3391835 RepID=UPI0039C8C42F